MSNSNSDNRQRVIVGLVPGVPGQPKSALQRLFDLLPAIDTDEASEVGEIRVPRGDSTVLLRYTDHQHASMTASVSGLISADTIDQVIEDVVFENQYVGATLFPTTRFLLAEIDRPDDTIRRLWGVFFPKGVKVESIAAIRPRQTAEMQSRASNHPIDYGRALFAEMRLIQLDVSAKGGLHEFLRYNPATGLTLAHHASPTDVLRQLEILTTNHTGV